MPPTFAGQSSLLADRYRIERELGRGGMAVVYLAHDTRHDRQVAIKFIGEDFSSAVGSQRFLQEIKLTAALQHPHVLPVYDSGVTTDNVLYYVMPFVEGGSLRERLATGPLPLADVVKVARGAADALTFAHQRGIVHRDIKPENILFSDGHALVADFGIARMVTDTKAQQLTAVGVIVGTPAYMSPEQGFGSVVDHRSDVYSLACVVYEMLTGKVPFSSPAAGQWTQFGLSRMPPSIRAERAEVPEALETEIVRALAPSPQDRHASAREFADALQAAAGTVATPYVPKSGGPATRSRRAWRGGLIVGATLAVFLTTAVAFFPPAKEQLVAFGVIDVDPTKVLLAPVQADSQHAAIARAADRALRLELSRWTGVTVASPELTRDAIGAAPVLDDAVRGARRLRAGTVVWALVRPEASGVVAEVQAFDPRRVTSQASSMAPVPLSDSGWARWARTTAAALLAGADVPAVALRSAGSTRSRTAWSAYVRGHQALEAWDLWRADTAFANAVVADARFAAARAWLAQTMVWTRRVPVSDWRRHADESLMLASALHPDERVMVDALSAMGRRDAPRACERYAALVARDSLDARAWLGLGDCSALDDVVIPSMRSPTGYAFRGNFTAAIEAYERAVRLSPAAHAALPVALIDRLIPTRVERVRRGFSLPDTNRSFVARPTPAGDSVVYVPQPLVNDILPSDPPGFEEALHRNRIRMLEYVSAWTQRMPDRDAFEALASVQESRGELVGVAARGRLSALASLDTALRLANDGESRARISSSRVRVLLKAGEFERARALADSLLAKPTNAAKEAHWLAGVAAATGRVREASRLARLGDTPPVNGWDTLPAPVGMAATLLLAQSAAGVCDDAFRASVTAMEELIVSYGVPAQRESIRGVLMHKARRLAAPCLGTGQIANLQPRSPWDRMLQRLGAGDTAGARATYDTLQQSRRNRRPGGTAVDFTYIGAWILAQAGDSAEAVRHLDQTLNALPTLNLNAVWEIAQSAALGRTLVLRADLAAARGDTQNMKRWSAAVATLWRNADPELQPTVRRMKDLASPR